MIASEAGVSRPTLYAYFENRDEIIDQAAIAATESFVERVVAHARTFESASERLVEATLFSIRGIHAEPALAMRFRAGQLMPGPLTVDELFYAKACLGPVVELAPSLESWIDEASELAARVVISLLSREPVQVRTEVEDRCLPESVVATGARHRRRRSSSCSSVGRVQTYGGCSTPCARRLSGAGGRRWYTLLRTFGPGLAGMACKKMGAHRMNDDGGAVMILNLSESLAEELSDTLGEVVSDMSSEIADTDNPNYRAKLQARRERLAAIRTELGA